MTLENSKRLYKHFLDNGMKNCAEAIAKKRPEVVEKPKAESKPSKKK